MRLEAPATRDAVVTREEDKDDTHRTAVHPSRGASERAVGEEATAASSELPTIVLAEDNEELAAYLEDILAETCRIERARDGVEAHCRFEHDGLSIDLDADVSSNLYRIAEEAVHNAVRHGSADQITIRLDQSSEELILTIQDDGVGFESTQIEEGLGLRTMRYRANQLDARLTVDSSRENGTAVQVRMPV